VKFGIPIGNFGAFGKHGGAPDLLTVAERAELLGYDSVWLHDHIFMPARIESRYPYNEAGSAGFAYRQDIYDPLAVMAAVAVRTTRVRIGTSVLIVPYRNPLHMAKMLATLDQLAHGRVILGIGVGWMEEEFVALGLGDRFPVRGRVTDEQDPTVPGPEKDEMPGAVAWRVDGSNPPCCRKVFPAAHLVLDLRGRNAL